MKKIILIVTSLLFINTTIAKALVISSQENVFDEILVSVSGRKISLKDFYDRYLLYKSLFIKQLKFDTLASEADDATVAKQRQSYRDQLSKEEISRVVSGSEKLWLEFKKANAPTDEAFEQKLKFNNLNEAYVKSKFIDNLLMLYYFDKVIAPQLVEVLVNESVTIEAASSVSVTNQEVETYILKIAEDLGGEAALNQFLKKNKIDKADFYTSAKKDLLITKFKENLNKQDIKGLEESKKLYYENRLDSEFTKAKQIYFSKFFMVKDQEILKEQNTAMHDILNKLKKGTSPLALTDDYSSLGFRYEQMYYPYEPGSKLYLEPICGELEKLDNGEYSDIFEVNDTFYIVKAERISPKSIIPYEDVEKDIETKVLGTRNENIFALWLKDSRAKSKIEYNDQLLDKIFSNAKALSEDSNTTPQKTITEVPLTQASADEPLKASNNEFNSPANQDKNLILELQGKISNLKKLIPDDMASLRETPKQVLLNANKSNTHLERASIEVLKEELLRLQRIVAKIQSINNYER